MIEGAHFLIGFPDFGRQEHGRLFVWDGQSIAERTFDEISEYAVPLVSFGYAALASEMLHRNLPLLCTIVDLEELCLFISRESDIRRLRKKFEISEFLERFGVKAESLAIFHKLSYSTDPFPLDVLEAIGRGMQRMFQVVSRLASIRGEWDRFWSIEVPVTRVLFGHLLRGIAFDERQLRIYRDDAEYDYYSTLKKFSAKHDLPLAVPTRRELNAKLSELGFDLQNTSPEFILEFIALEDDLGSDLVALRGVRAVRDALSGVSHKKSVTFPEVLVHGTRTSRVLLKTPNLQNIPTKYRDVLKPFPSLHFSYVDYDQFEVGIMAALSGDARLLELYESDDLYNEVSEQLFGTSEKRKEAKRLFLSYAYGMSMPNLIKAAISLGSNKDLTKNTFSQFVTFEQWKDGVAKELAASRKIGTTNGNFFYLTHNHKPSAKDVRSAVSQKVQGTGALIFKKAILAIAGNESFRIVLPMHDAVLVEHQADVDPAAVVVIFENTMTEALEGKVSGKASISSFAAA